MAIDTRLCAWNGMQGVVGGEPRRQRHRLSPCESFSKGGQSHAALRRGESVIRKQMIESHEQELLRHQDAHQVEIVRREEELQRQLRMRQEKRGSAQLEVAGARSTTPRAPRGSRPELQHRPSVMERKQMIEDHEQALQREQSAQQDKILRAEEELHRQLRERQERRANRPGSAAQREPTA